MSGFQNQIVLWALAVAIACLTPQRSCAQNADGGAHQIQVTDSGFIYVYGPYYGRITLGSFVFGDTVSQSKGYFLCKMTGSGQVVWALNLGGAYNNCYGYCPQEFWMAVDKRGDNIWLTAGRIDSPFLGQSFPGMRIFKISAGGALVWQQPLSLATFHFYGLDVDAAGNAYVAANFDKQFGVGTSLLPASDTNHAATGVAKLSPSGAVLWMREIDTLAYDGWSYSHETYFLTADSSGAVYVGGMASRVKIVGQQSVSTGWYPFVAGLDAAGNTIFKTRYDVNWWWGGGGTHVILGAGAVSPRHSLFVGGRIRDTVFVAPQVPVITLPNHPHSYVAKTSTATGYAHWYQDNQSAAGSFDHINTLAADSSDNLYFAGDGVNSVIIDGHAITGTGSTYWARLDPGGAYNCHYIEQGAIEQSTLANGLFYYTARSPRVNFGPRYQGDTIRIRIGTATGCTPVSTINIPEKWYVPPPIGLPGTPPALGTAPLLYPNPVSDGWMYLAGEVDIARLQLEVYNSMSQRMTCSITGRKLDVSAWPPGVYVYRLRDGVRIARGKFVIQ